MTDDAQRTIGKYRIMEKIGQGGFGDVYKAEDSVLGSTVALKLLAPHYMRDPNVVQRFRREARSAARLRHANIVRIYDLAEEQGTLYLAMDYLPGRSLAQILAERGSLPLSEVVSILTQVAGALDYAHQQGLVHRDVKPGNIMVDDAGRVTLMDFGLVKAADNTKWSMMQMTGGSEFTTGGAMMGTPQYMAPEQAEPNAGAAAIASWTDIYSLGVVVYQMVTGRVPFQATTPLAVLRGHVDKEPRPPSELAEVPPGVEAAILRALAKHPESRWPTAGRFAEALATAAREAEDAARREDQLTAAYEQAQQAIAEERWAQALALCGQIMSLDASFGDVGELFDQANMGMVRQREWEAQQAELAASYDEAVAHMAAGEWDEAIAALERVEATSSDYIFRDTVQKLAQAREARERALAERREQLTALREAVLSSVAEALEWLQEIQAFEPDYPGLERLVTLLEEARSVWAPETVILEEEAPPTVSEAAEAAKVREQPVAVVPEEPPELPPERERLPFEPEMVHVPEGEFTMGSAEDDLLAYWDEKPQHVVYLDSYRIGKHPVTNAQYRTFVEETGCEVPWHWLKGWFTKRVGFPEHLKDHPVTSVSWKDATAYCKWLSRKTGRSYRLPTEAEWEKAARGSDGRRYPWGDDWDAEKANTRETSLGLQTTTAVGSYPAGASPYGALDMAGNVWEWCQDLYDQDYYAVSPDCNPQGPTYGSKRVLRGGASWYSDERFVRTAKRLKRASFNASNRVGFRCVEGISHDAGDKSAGGASSDGKEVT